MQRRFPVILSVVLAVFAIAFAPQCALAAGEVFTVRNIPVDATAAGASDAREIAIAQGQRVAFDHLMHRLTRRQDWASAPQVTPEQINALVLGIEVAEERSSATRYIGKITYSFKPAAVRQFLRTSGVPFSESRAKPALLLPVFDGPDGQHLWDDPNPWRSAWAKRELGEELVPIMVPLNDLEDSSYVSAAQASSATWADTASIAGKYGLDRVLVAHASVRGHTLDVRLTQLSSTSSQSSAFSVPLGGDMAAALDQGVSSALDRLYEDWKVATIVVPGQQNSVYVSIWYSNLADWLTIQRRLNKAPNISEMAIIGLSPQGAEVRLTYGGTIDQLKVTMEQVSLRLSDRGGYWELGLAERAAGGATPAATNGLAPADAPKPPDTGNTN